jgi:hypothetical protein
MKRTTLVITVALVGAFAATMYAERPKESEDKATFIVTGTVQKVFERDSGSNTDYVVQIRIDAVEKGDGLKPRDYVYAYCFRRKSDAPREPSASGHGPPPKEQQRIRARIKHSRGRMEGLYPRWFDVISEETKK